MPPAKHASAQRLINPPLGTNTSAIIKAAHAQYKNTAKINELTFSNTKMEEKIDSHEPYKKHVSSLLTFKNKVIGVSFLGILVITGSYIYCFSNNINSITTHSRLEDRIETQNKEMINYIADLRSDLNQLAINQGRIDEKYQFLTNQLDLANERLAKILEMMNKD